MKTRNGGFPHNPDLGSGIRDLGLESRTLPDSDEVLDGSKAEIRTREQMRRRESARRQVDRFAVRRLRRYVLTASWHSYTHSRSRCQVINVSRDRSQAEGRGPRHGAAAADCCGATCEGRVVETNRLFDTPDGRLRRGERGLRVRSCRRESGQAPQPTLTYKGRPMLHLQEPRRDPDQPWMTPPPPLRSWQPWALSSSSVSRSGGRRGCWMTAT